MNAWLKSVIFFIGFAVLLVAAALLINLVTLRAPWLIGVVVAVGLVAWIRYSIYASE